MIHLSLPRPSMRNKEQWIVSFHLIFVLSLYTLLTISKCVCFINDPPQLIYSEISSRNLPVKWGIRYRDLPKTSIGGTTWMYDNK